MLQLTGDWLKQSVAAGDEETASSYWNFSILQEIFLGMHSKNHF